MVDLKIELPEHFLEEEVRCEHRIPVEMKQLWAVELDLTAELLRVCKKYDIQIFACGGTELGAVRHRGFIPWDDDMDFMMTRSEYDRLCAVAPREFREPYFFQTEYTDPGSMRCHAQLRNSRTTAVLEVRSEKDWSFNQGIFLDIFPMDHVTPDPEALRQQVAELKKLQHFYTKLARYSTHYRPARNGKLKRVVKSIVHSVFSALDRRLGIIRHWYRKYERVCQRYNSEPTENLGMLFFDDEACWPMRAKTFERVVWLPFEHLEIPVSADYDEQLQACYGDYMEFVKGTAYHGGMEFSAEIPYTEYLKQKRHDK